MEDVTIAAGALHVALHSITCNLYICPREYTGFLQHVVVYMNLFVVITYTSLVVGIHLGTNQPIRPRIWLWLWLWQ